MHWLTAQRKWKGKRSWTVLENIFFDLGARQELYTCLYIATRVVAPLNEISAMRTACADIFFYSLWPGRKSASKLKANAEISKGKKWPLWPMSDIWLRRFSFILHRSRRGAWERGIGHWHPERQSTWQSHQGYSPPYRGAPVILKGGGRISNEKLFSAASNRIRESFSPKLTTFQCQRAQLSACNRNPPGLRELVRY